MKNKYLTDFNIFLVDSFSSSHTIRIDPPPPPPLTCFCVSQLSVCFQPLFFCFINFTHASLQTFLPMWYPTLSNTTCPLTSVVHWRNRIQSRTLSRPTLMWGRCSYLQRLYLSDPSFNRDFISMFQVSIKTTILQKTKNVEVFWTLVLSVHNSNVSHMII
mgnify:CR=1 FL=1